MGNVMTNVTLFLFLVIFFLMVNYSKKLMGWIPVGRKYVEVLREVGAAGTQGTGVSKNKGVVSVFPTIK